MCGLIPNWNGPSQTITQYGAPSTYTLACNTGYYLRSGTQSSGQCTGAYTCWSWGTYATCSSVCVEGGSPCYYCCVCSTAYSFQAINSVCDQCVPPAAANAINPATVAGTNTYTWSCALGFWGAQVTRSCSNTGGGAWSGGAIGCTSCAASVPAAPPNGGLSVPVAGTYTYTCNAGFYNPSGSSLLTLQCNNLAASAGAAITTVVGSGTTISCAPCTVPNFCTGAQPPAPCPAGTFAASAGLATSACSGACTAGYYCPAGSSTSTTYPCGGVGVYCPTGSGSPATVATNYYSTPLAAPAAYRTGQAPCPANRVCSGGTVQPGIDMSVSCAGGKMNVALAESTAGNQGPQIAYTTPGASGLTISMAVASLTAVDVSCTVTPGQFAFDASSHTYALISTAPQLVYANCPNGFTLQTTATRSDSAASVAAGFGAITAQCAMTVTVLQVARPPVITDCSARTVPERSLIGAAIGNPIGATNPNVGTSLLFSFAQPATGPVPVSIGMCDGTIRVLSNIVWATLRSFTLDIVVTNNGAAIGIGSSTSTCTMVVTVQQVPEPPALTTTTFYVAELLAAPALVGNVGAIDPNGFAVTSISFSASDSPNDFTIDALGNIHTSAVVDTIALQKSVWTYTVRAANSFTSSPTVVTINVLPVPRPPVVLPQRLSAPENIAAGVALTGPALQATQPQGTPFSFALTPTTYFQCTPAGVVSRSATSNISYNALAASGYTITATIVVTTSAGLVATAPLVVTITEVNWPPFFAALNYYYTIAEGSPSGAAVTTPGTAPAFTDRNLDQTHPFQLLSSTPAVGASTFTLNAFTAEIDVGGAALAAMGGALVFDATQAYPQPQTYQLSLQVADDGVPVMTGAGTAWVTVVQIRPRFVFTPPQTSTYRLPGAPAVGYLAINCSAITWTPLSRASLQWSMSADATAEGGTVFVMNAATGHVTIANTTYYASSSSGSANSSGAVTGWGPPLFNYNTRNAFNVNVTATQTADGTARTVTLVVLLAHVNRPPTWMGSAYFYAPASLPGTVGSPLVSLVYDPDVALGVGENFTFAITAGNTDATFGIDASSGQLSVVNPNTPAISLPGPGFFNLTVSVTDAGIDGPRYSALGYACVNITANLLPPQLNYTVLTVAELVPLGTVVGTVAAIERDLTRLVYYSLQPRGPNVNRPFPFAVTTHTQPGTQNVGVITVIAGPGPVDFNAFPAYNCTLTACNDNPTAPLCVSAPLDIVVQWVPTPPFFNPSPAAAYPWVSPPASQAFSLSVVQHPKPGMWVGPAAVAAGTRDGWRQSALTYSWVNPGLNNSVVFAIDPATGNVTIALGNTVNLDVSAQDTYYLTAKVTDNNVPALTDTAAVVITLIDTGDPATFVGLYGTDNATALPGWAFSVNETAGPGTAFGYVRAVGVDRVNPSWAILTYGLVAAPDSVANFAINPQSGALSVSYSSTGFYYWDQTFFTFNVTATDGNPVAPITIAQSVTVRLVQSNTVSVSGFYVGAATTAAQAANASTSPYAAAYPTTSVLFTTLGSTVAAPVRVYIAGSGFGPTLRRQTLFLVAYSISATYGNAAHAYAATGCQVEAPNTLVSCLAAPGVGANLSWAVSVSVPGATTWTSPPSTATTAYYPPNVTAVSKLGSASQLLATAGGESLNVTGFNVGPSAGNNSATLYYGPAAALGGGLVYKTAACSWLTSQQAVSCTSVPGVGANLTFVLQVGGQNSTPFSATAVAYTPPAVTAVTSNPARALDTAGLASQTITVNGTNFGPGAPVAGLPAAVTYSQSFLNASWYTVFAAVNCAMPADGIDTAFICTPAPGAGGALHVVVTVGGQSSAPSSGTIGYLPPSISVSGISGTGAANADTAGGDAVAITGLQFGPLTPTDAAGDPLPGFLQPVVAYGHAGVAPIYTAAACRVSVPSSAGAAAAAGQIRCVTAPGCGAGLVWRVTVGEQTSAASVNVTSYHAPIVASYSGPGSDLAVTEGDQAVDINGKNFGPLGCPITSVTYGSDANSTQFTAYNCSMTAAHTDITCYTAVGAGAGLKWKVTMDGQLSVTPTTDYGVPVIYSFSGPGAVNAGTDGGDVVIITGYFFSVQSFLQGVSYGPTGAEYNAFASCNVTTPHRAITCVTLPGAGRLNSWLITVGGQTNDLGALTTSYAAPAVASITPGNLSTAGGMVHINGTNFALLAPGAPLVIKFNSGAASARPPPAALAAHYASVYAGGGGLASVNAWLESMQTLLPAATYVYSRGVHGLDVAIPEGFGFYREVVVVVAGVPSLPAALSYDAPVILNIAPDFQFVGRGLLRVQVDGYSLCNPNAFPGCGDVLVNGASVAAQVMYPPPWNTTLPPPPPPATGGGGTPAVQWGDGFLAFWMAQQAQGTTQTLVVLVNGVPSAPVAFSKPVPSINALATQNSWINVDTLGGTVFYIAGVMDVVDDVVGRTLYVTVGGRNCPVNYDPVSGTYVDNGINPVANPTDASYRVSCTMPPGVGLGALNPVVVASSTGNSSTAAGLSVEYAPPRIDSEAIVTPFLPPAYAVAPSSRLLASPGSPGPVPTLGAVITVSGRYFGLPTSGGSPLITAGPPGPGASGFMAPCPLLSRNDSALTVQLPPGDGRGNLLQFAVGQQLSAVVTFDYAAPTVVAAVPAVGPAVGGTQLTLHGYNFGVSPNAVFGKPAPYAAVGPNNCTIVSALPPALNQSALNCTLPRGQGMGLPVTLWVNGQLSTAPAALFSYTPPAVTRVAPAHGPTSGRTPGVYDAITGVTSLGARIVCLVSGTDLGRAGTVVFNVTAASGPRAQTLTVPPADVLTTAAFAFLLAQAGGNASAVPGMALTDAQIATLWAAAGGSGNSSGAAAGAGGGGGGGSLFTPGVATAPLVGRMWNETQVWFLLPPGLGANLQVSVIADQTGASAALFSYDPPTISLIINADFQRMTDNCVPTVVNSSVGYLARERGVLPKLVLLYPGCYPTTGGFIFMFVGEGFGPPAEVAAAVTVTVGGRICTVVTTYETESGVTSDFNHIFCAAPAGYGVDLPVVVNVAGRASAPGNASWFSYDPPLITGFDPNVADALGVAQLGVAGANFGAQPSATTLAINGLPCGAIDYRANDYLFCAPQADVVGAKNVTLYIANATVPAQVLDVQEMLVYVCAPGYYGLEGEVCLPCPVVSGVAAATCPGGERFVDLVNSTAGFWRSNLSVASTDAREFCDAPRLATRAAAGCPAMLPCQPPGACLGNNTCAYGYVDARCADCLPGLYYRVNGACVKCPDNLYVLYAGLALLLVLVAIAGYFLNKKNVNLAIIAIGVDYFQVVSLFAKTNIRWPGILTSLFTWLSVFNLNLDIVAPECLNPGISFQAKWLFIEGLPLLLITLFCGVFVVKILYKLACTTKTDKRALYAHAPAMVASVIVVFRLLFLYLTRTSLDVMICLPTTPPQFQDTSNPANPTNPLLYMAGLLGYPCWSGWQVILFPLGLGTLGFYSLVLPLAALWLLRRSREAVKYDQILRLKGLGNDTLTNPKYYRFRKMWSKLYVNYKPGKWYWELVIVARKFLIAITSLVFAQVGSYQLAICLLVLFVAFVLHTQHLPYVTHENKGQILEDHLSKVLAGDKLHGTIESDMRAIEKHNTRKRTKQNVFQGFSLPASIKADTSSQVILWVFDANTVEAILLASAILVNLSGIMFDSARFSGDNLYIYYNEYTGIAITVVVLIALTIIYYITTILLELTVVFCPGNVAPMLACLALCFRSCSRRKIQEAAIIAARKKGGRAPRRSSMGGMEINMMMMRARDGDAADAELGVVDAAAIAGISMPTAAMWSAVKGSYATLTDTVRALQGDVAGLKRALQDAGGGGGAGAGAGAAAGAARSRTRFRPQMRNAAADGGDGDEEAAAAAAALAAGVDGGDFSLSSNPMAAGRSPGGGAGAAQAPQQQQAQQRQQQRGMGAFKGTGLRLAAAGGGRRAATTMAAPAAAAATARQQQQKRRSSSARAGSQVARSIIIGGDGDDGDEEEEQVEEEEAASAAKPARGGIGSSKVRAGSESASPVEAAGRRATGRVSLFVAEALPVAVEGGGAHAATFGVEAGEGSGEGVEGAAASSAPRQQRRALLEVDGAAQSLSSRAMVARRSIVATGPGALLGPAASASRLAPSGSSSRQLRLAGGGMARPSVTAAAASAGDVELVGLDSPAVPEE